MAQSHRRESGLCVRQPSPTRPLSSRATQAFDNATKPASRSHVQLHPPNERPSFTFVCLGVGGGPLEGDCSCYLLKPAHRQWHDGSVVIEGGSWLGALTRVLEDVGPDSAFHDVNFPFDSPALRAGFIGSFAHSFLLSHAHLDHILGMVLGSASLPGKRSVYGLKGTLDNLMDVFNGKIWPKLASYSAEGPAVYHLKAIETQERTIIDNDLSFLPFSLSHGLNPAIIPAPPTPTHVYAQRSSTGKRLSLPANGYFAGTFGHLSIQDPQPNTPNTERPVFTSPFVPENTSSNQVIPVRVRDNELPPEANPSPTDGVKESTAPFKVPNSVPLPAPTAPRKSRRPRTAQGSEKHPPSQEASRHASVASSRRHDPHLSPLTFDEDQNALDSTAFFITNEVTKKDVLFFGDVEPDSISQQPRNVKVWAHAAQRFANHKLNTVFLECSFPASHPTEFLYGHLSVAHVFDELRTLARSVVAERKRIRARQQRRNPSRLPMTQIEGVTGGSFTRKLFHLPQIPALHTSERTIKNEELQGSLAGLSVVIIHVKTALFPSFQATPKSSATSNETNSKEKLEHSITHVDPRSMQDRILDELNEAEQQNGYGVRFIIAKQGMRIEC